MKATLFLSLSAECRMSSTSVGGQLREWREHWKVVSAVWAGVRRLGQGGGGENEDKQMPHRSVLEVSKGQPVVG